MTGREAFEIWAPAGKQWVDWVRPVPFIGVQAGTKTYQISGANVPVFEFPVQKSVQAVIVDLPGAESVMAGIALAKLGYRPVPIYNGTIEQPGARATVDNQSVGMALLWGAEYLLQIPIHENAPPAFLTDSNRMHRFKMEASLFDNSWDVYPQDLPSAEYFLEKGIHKIIILGEALSRDLQKILYDFQRKKIDVYITNGYTEPRKLKVRRPLLRDLF